MTKIDWLKSLEDNVSDLGQIVARFNPDSRIQWAAGVRDKDITALGNILQETWELAPDAPWIHKIPGWGVLCDLCSEFIFGELE